MEKENLKIWVVATNSLYGDVGVQCAMAIAATQDEALQIIRNNIDADVVVDNLKEVPLEHGYTYIGGWIE